MGGETEAGGPQDTLRDGDFAVTWRAAISGESSVWTGGWDEPAEAVVGGVGGGDARSSSSAPSGSWRGEPIGEKVMRSNAESCSMVPAKPQNEHQN